MTRTKNVKAFVVVLLSLALMIAFMPSAAFTSYAATASKVTKITKVKGVKSSYTFVAGKSYSFKVKLSPKNLKSTKKTTTVTSSKTSVAKISSKKYSKSKGYYYVSFKVKAIKAGSTTVKALAKYGKKSVKWTIKVKAAPVAATGVTVAGTAAVGQALTATVAPTTATATYQWYADGVAITGATSATYKLTVAELGKVITVKATAGGKTVESTATAKVVATTVTASKITGMTGDANSDKTMDTPIVGDTLKVETTPAVESGLTYQWKANGTAIVGATKAEYPVVASDAGKAISCTITGSDGVTVNAAAANPAIANVVKANIASVAQINLQKDNAATSTLNESYPILGDPYAITVTDKTSSTNRAFTNGTEYTVKWYLDSVSDDNLLAGTADSITPEVASASKLVGHKLVVVVSGKSTSGYMGTIQAETPVVQVDATDLTVTVYKEDGTTAVGADPNQAVVGEKLTAKATLTGADAKFVPTVSYSWIYDYGMSGAKSLSASDTYSMTQEIATGITGGKSIKIVAAGTGNVQGSAANTSSLVTANVNASAPEMKVSITNAADAAKGVALTAQISPSAYDSDTYVTYAWYKEALAGTVSTANDTKVANGKTFTPTENGSYYVAIKAVDNTKATAAAISGGATSVAEVVVANPISKTTVSAKATRSGNDVTSAFRTGDEITVSVKDGASALHDGSTTSSDDYDVVWYKNEVKDANILESDTSTTAASYAITNENVFNGDTIIAVVKGVAAQGYTGQAQAATTFKAQYYGEAPTATSVTLAATAHIGSKIDDVTFVAPTPLGSGNTYNTKAVTYKWYRLTAAQKAELAKTNSLGQALSAAEQLKIVQGGVALVDTKDYTPVEADKDAYLACVVTAPGYESPVVVLGANAVGL